MLDLKDKLSSNKALIINDYSKDVLCAKLAENEMALIISTENHRIVTFWKSGAPANRTLYHALDQLCDELLHDESTVNIALVMPQGLQRSYQEYLDKVTKQFKDEHSSLKLNFIIKDLATFAINSSGKIESYVPAANTTSGNANKENMKPASSLESFGNGLKNFILRK